MASFVTNLGKRLMLDRGGDTAATIDLEADTIKVALITSAATPDYDYDYMDHYTATELSCTGYTAGWGSASRKTVAATKSWATDTANELIKFDSTADLTWTTCGAAYAGAAVKYIALIKEVTNDAASPVIAIFELATTVMPNGGDLVLAWNGSGLINITN